MSNSLESDLGAPVRASPLNGLFLLVLAAAVLFNVGALVYLLDTVFSPAEAHSIYQWVVSLAPALRGDTADWRGWFFLTDTAFLVVFLVVVAIDLIREGLHGHSSTFTAGRQQTAVPVNLAVAGFLILAILGLLGACLWPSGREGDELNSKLSGFSFGHPVDSYRNFVRRAIGVAPSSTGQDGSKAQR